MRKDIKVQYKKMKGTYGETDGKTIWIDKAKFKGINGLDTIIHEKNHAANMRASERAIVDKTKKQMDSYLSII